MAANPTSGRCDAPGGGHTELADALWSAMSAVRRAGRRVASQPSALRSLTGAQLELVRLLRRSPGLSIADAAAGLRLAPNTVSTLVRQLTEAGTLTRGVDGDDRRVARLELSAEIRRSVDAWRDRRVIMLSSVLEGLPPADVRCLARAAAVLEHVADELAAAEGSPAVVTRAGASAGAGAGAERP